jgi:Homeodomain-like domain
MAKAQLPAVRLPPQLLRSLVDSFERSGFQEWKATCKDGRLAVVGKAGGMTIRVADYASDGFNERTVSRSEGLSPRRRREEAGKMHRDGFTQTEIADRLGCSQRTISGDLSRVRRARRRRR